MDLGTTADSERARPSGRQRKASALRVTPFIGLLLGVTLLSTGLLVTASATAAEEQHERTLERDADQVSASFSSYFERARDLDRLLARDRAFVLTDAGTIDRQASNRALAYLEVLYPDAIGEACIINEQGRELARVTEGQWAHGRELSPDESSSRFFAPTLALGVDQVYQARPYVSPDTGRWVISNSTWVPVAGGGRLIVHFEVSLDSFVPYVSATGTNRHVAVVNRTDGQILLQDRTALPRAIAETRFPVTTWSKRFASESDAAGTTPVNGHHGRFRVIDRQAGNANDWAVVEWSTARASLVPASLGVAATAAAVIMIAMALVVLRRQQRALRAAARLDHLTGLANRKALEETLDDALDVESSRADGSVAVLVIDLDGFKQVNDALGHAQGDLVLQEIARRLHANVFEHDFAARLGGDEFAVVLRQLRDADDVVAVAHRLREALIKPIDIDGTPRFVGASIGAAVYPLHGGTSADLLRNADAAMYRAKQNREGVRVYEVGTPAGASALGLAAELSSAIEEEIITLVFQPEFSLKTGAIVGVEALARWERAGHGPVSPTEFIGLAEETGLIRSLTSLTLRLALDEAKTWHRAGVHIPVSVNLSGRVVGDRSLPAEVNSLLAERGLAANALVLEITETAAINERENALAVIGQLRTAGVRMELDDFGAGYASFGALRDLPLDGVKIDRALVAEHGDGARLLAATIQTALRLGLEVVAEGIEDEPTLELVRRLGCHKAQGYHLARPMVSDALRTLLQCELPVAPLVAAV
ncbi:MAG: putative signaling protein [Actinomycetia bacterium]|nr:putative signaling protein [Actinomycetes bacterium]